MTGVAPLGDVSQRFLSFLNVMHRDWFMPELRLFMEYAGLVMFNTIDSLGQFLV